MHMLSWTLNWLESRNISFAPIKSSYPGLKKSTQGLGIAQPDSKVLAIFQSRVLKIDATMRLYINHTQSPLYTVFSRRHFLRKVFERLKLNATFSPLNIYCYEQGPCQFNCIQRLCRFTHKAWSPAAAVRLFFFLC